MPKLHDLCQQFWEELSAASGADIHSCEEIVEAAHIHLQTCNPQNAGIIAEHLLILAREMELTEIPCDRVGQLVEELFG